jgi:histidinol-phosphate aminotransferase
MDVVRHGCAGGEGAVLGFEHTFHLLRAAARAAGASVVSVPVGAGFARDPEALADRVDDSVAVVYVDNPPNPTTHWLGAEELRWLLRALPDRVTVIVDEAYHHFAAADSRYETALAMADLHPRLVVTRTYSKAYGLAGLRIGFAVTGEETAARLREDRIPFSVTVVSDAALRAAMIDHEHLERNIAAAVEGRARLAAGLAALGMDLLSGLSNFVLLRVPDQEAAAAAFRGEGIAVNSLPQYGFSGWIRVSAGNPDEIAVFLDAARRVLAPVAGGSGAVARE